MQATHESQVCLATRSLLRGLNLQAEAAGLVQYLNVEEASLDQFSIKDQQGDHSMPACR